MSERGSEPVQALKATLAMVAFGLLPTAYESIPLSMHAHADAAVSQTYYNPPTLEQVLATEKRVPEDPLMPFVVLTSFAGFLYLGAKYLRVTVDDIPIPPREEMCRPPRYL